MGLILSKINYLVLLFYCIHLNLLCSGSQGATTSYSNHPCVVQQSSSTTASSGYAFSTGQSAFLLLGNESTTFIFKKNY